MKRLLTLCARVDAMRVRAGRGAADARPISSRAASPARTCRIRIRCPTCP